MEIKPFEWIPIEDTSRRPNIGENVIVKDDDKYFGAHYDPSYEDTLNYEFRAGFFSHICQCCEGGTIIIDHWMRIK